ncbi:MAG: homocysteine S-methyltransferase family protein, partial [Coriobacteriales bacterium]|nr:homocysteine S-methyltransferase family protein [Coriobacteriales bacterium]
MKISKFIKNNYCILDGGFGTYLQEKLNFANTPSELVNLENPQLVYQINKEYFEAGANVVNANTFCVNPLKYDNKQIEQMIETAYTCLSTAKKDSKGKQKKFLSLDIGPLGQLLEPYGTLSFNDALAAYSTVMKIASNYKFDLVTIATFNDLYELKAAIIAAKTYLNIPIFVSCTINEDSKLMCGTSIKNYSQFALAMQVDAVGLNCSFGPEQMLNAVQELCENTNLPVYFKPNAGLPIVENGKTKYDCKIEDFVKAINLARKVGATILGGCCGTNPKHILRISKLLKHKNLPKSFKKMQNSHFCDAYATSTTNYLNFENNHILIGESINPTNNKLVKEALIDEDYNVLVKLALKQKERGAHALDVNVGLPQIDQTKVLPQVIKSIQAVCDLPLVIDSTNIKAVEEACKIYNGIPIINSVNAAKESLNAIFPIAKLYGARIIALCLDENGVPKTVEGRLKCAEKILKSAQKHGISAYRLIFDPICMTASADLGACAITLDTINALNNEFGLNTVIGLSNISHGLPNRSFFNANFYSFAAYAGLNAAIINVLDNQIMKTYHANQLIFGEQNSSLKYIEIMQDDNYSQKKED